MPRQSVEIPRAPAWQQPADATTFTLSTVAAEARRAAPGALITGADSTYTPISHEWLESFVAWTWRVAPIIGVTYVPESFDCENFANLFAEIVALKAAQAGQRSAPLVAKVTVTAPGGTRHALVGVATDRGLYLIEPQPAAGPFRIKPVAAFKERILAIEFGLMNPP